MRTPDVRRGLHYDLARAPVTADDLVRLDETLAWARGVLEEARRQQQLDKERAVEGVSVEAPSQTPSDP